MEEDLDTLYIKTLKNSYLVWKSDVTYSVKVADDNFVMSISTEDISKVLKTIEHLFDEPLLEGEWSRNLRVSSKDSEFYVVKKSGSAMYIRGLSKDLLRVPLTDIKEVVDAIRILTGETKWKTS